jgi:hypothetical protein
MADRTGEGSTRVFPSSIPLWRNQMFEIFFYGYLAVGTALVVIPHLYRLYCWIQGKQDPFKTMDEFLTFFLLHPVLLILFSFTWPVFLAILAISKTVDFMENKIISWRKKRLEKRNKQDEW